MTGLPRFTCYVLLSERGELYVGYTAKLRRRVRQHNAGKSAATRGRRWHLVAAKHFLDKSTALRAEQQMKREKHRWAASTERLIRLVERHGITPARTLERWMDPDPATRRSSQNPAG